MRVTLTPSIRERLELLRGEVRRLEVLEKNGFEFEVVDDLESLQESEKVEILRARAKDLTPAAVLELLAFTIQITATCQRLGARFEEPLSTFIEGLGQKAIARRSRSGVVH